MADRAARAGRPRCPGCPGAAAAVCPRLRRLPRPGELLRPGQARSRRTARARRSTSAGCARWPCWPGRAHRQRLVRRAALPPGDHPGQHHRPAQRPVAAPAAGRAPMATARRRATEPARRARARPRVELHSFGRCPGSTVSSAGVTTSPSPSAKCRAADTADLTGTHTTSVVAGAGAFDLGQDGRAAAAKPRAVGFAVTEPGLRHAVPRRPRRPRRCRRRRRSARRHRHRRCRRPIPGRRRRRRPIQGRRTRPADRFGVVNAVRGPDAVLSRQRDGVTYRRGRR